MRLYKTKNGAVIEKDNQFYAVHENWDELVNDDGLYDRLLQLTQTAPAGNEGLIEDLLPPVAAGQELWACGVTYLRSKIGRQEESKAAGGADFYGKVYEAERPEVFFKSTAHRIVGPGAFVRIRKDSSWDVPEPELTLVVTASGKIVGYTVGNDMSSRSIEGENPLYLPQAKTYDGSAAVGPCIYVPGNRISSDTNIHLVITRKKEVVFTGDILLNQMKRTPEELVSYVYRECSFPHGCLVMTGTGIVPGHDFTLQSGDEIAITIDNIGTLVNTVQ